MTHEELTPEPGGQYRRHQQALDAELSSLYPNELVALARLVRHERTPNKIDIVTHLDYVALNDPARAVDLMTAFADSPFAEDRKLLTWGSLAELTRANHDVGFSLWNRLMGDADEEVRDEAELLLAECSGGRNLYPNTGFYKVESLNESCLTEDTGLTRQDAYDLYLSYAYAENGVYFDLGRAALAKINNISPPSESATIRHP